MKQEKSSNFLNIILFNPISAGVLENQDMLGPRGPPSLCLMFKYDK